MRKRTGITHIDTDESIRKSMEETGVGEKLRRLIENLKARRRAMGLPADANDKEHSTS